MSAVNEHPLIKGLDKWRETQVKKHKYNILRVCGNMVGRINYSKSLYTLYYLKEKMGDQCQNYLEIGTLFGANLCFLMQHPSKTRYVGIDLFEDGGLDPQKKVVPSIATVQKNIAPWNRHRHQYNLIKGDPQDLQTVKKFEDLKLVVDLMYIDGDQSYPGLLRNFMNYYQYLNQDGYLVINGFKEDDNNNLRQLGQQLNFQKLGFEVVGEFLDGFILKRTRFDHKTIERLCVYGVNNTQIKKELAAQKKSDHDVYWGHMLKFVKDNLSKSSSLQNLWKNVNYYEYREHSVLGRTGEENIPVIYLQKMMEMKFNDYLELKEDLILRSVKNYLTNETKAIIELGSGWGRNMLYLQMKLDQRKQPIDFHAGELSESGRKITKIISDKYQLNFNVFDCDLYRVETVLPQLKQYPPQSHLIICTIHAIEQIPFIDKSFFEQILATGHRFTFIHFEPIGWQIDGPHLLEEHGCKKRRTADILKSYNRNLIPVLRKLESEKKAKVLETEADFFGGINCNNAGSKVVWQSI